MTDTPRITKATVVSARQTLIDQGRKPSQRAVIKLLGGGSFSQVGPLLRELANEAGDEPGSALTEPLTAAIGEAVESVWRTLGQEADRVVSDARQQFEHDLKAAQGALAQTEAKTAHTQEALHRANAQITEQATSLAQERAALERIRAAFEQERLAHTKTETEREAAEALANEREDRRAEVESVRKKLASTLDAERQQSEAEVKALRDEAAKIAKETIATIKQLEQSIQQADTTITQHTTELQTLRRENSNLTTINDGQSKRIEHVQISLATAEGMVRELSAKHEAGEQALATLQRTMERRLEDKAQLIATLQALLNNKDGTSNDNTA